LSAGNGPTKKKIGISRVVQANRHTSSRPDNNLESAACIQGGDSYVKISGIVRECPSQICICARPNFHVSISDRQWPVIICFIATVLVAGGRVFVGVFYVTVYSDRRIRTGRKQ
jgi:hypothetical protein